MCCVPSCGSNTEILHTFPNPHKDMERFRSWLYNIGSFDLLGLDNDYFYKYQRVCHLHFEAQYHTRSKKLSPGAVPRLNLSAPKKKIVLADVTNIQQPDCKYTEPIVAPLPSTSAVHESPVLSATIKTEAIATTLPSTSGCTKEDQDKENNLFLQKPNVVRKPGNKKKITSTGARDLHSEIKKMQKKNNSYKERIKKANVLATNSAFQDALKKFKTLAAIFTILQFREISKPKIGRRFTKEEKIMALTVYKRGPKCYRWLSKLFILPSPLTLSRMMSRAALKPGINQNIFEQLKKKAHKMKPHERFCTLIFDKMSLTPHFDYNSREDKITGFVNHMGEPEGKIADHGLVFMIRGIVKNYKQPIYYSFCAGCTPKEVLVEQIKIIIRKLDAVGFTVLATVCDQGTSNVAAINALIEENRQQKIMKNLDLRERVFEVDGKVIIPLYDVPHLLKGLRNNLLTKDLKYKIEGKEKIAKWQHISQLYENNPTYKGLKIIKNLTECHCVKDKIPKMKVKFAAQIFSQTVGKTMGYLAENGILSKETQDTADFILFIDNLFDSLNGSFNNSNKKSKKL